MINQQATPSRLQALSTGLGALIVVLGLVHAAAGLLGGAPFLPPAIFRPLMLAIALTLACLHLLGTDGEKAGPAVDRLLIAGCCLLAGLVALWCFSLDPAADAGSPLDGAVHVTVLLDAAALLGCLAVLLLTWRLWGAALAVAGVMALLYAMTWRQGVDLSSAAAVWFDRDDGALGWLLEATLSVVLPVFLLGSVLADRFFSTSGRASGDDRTRLTDPLFAVVQVALPAPIIAALIMAARPEVDIPLVQDVPPAMAAILALGVVLLLGAVDVVMGRSPTVALQALARRGALFGTFLIAAAAVGMILAVLDRTGLPFDVAQLLAGAAGEARLPLVVLAVVVGAAFGAAMPAPAAYLIVVTLLGAAFRTVGLSDLTLHLIVLFACIGGSALQRFRQAASDVTETLPVSTGSPGNAASR